MRPGRHSTAAEFVRYSVENFGTPEAFASKPEAYRRDVAGKWARAITRSNYKARNARRVHLRAIGLSNAQAVTFSAMLEELSRLRDQRSGALWEADHYNSKAAEFLEAGDVDKAAAYTDKARRSLKEHESLDQEWETLYAEAQAIAARFPAITSTKLRALLDALDADSLNISSRCHRGKYVTPAARPPRTCSTFAHAPPALSMRRARTRSGKSRALERS